MLRKSGKKIRIPRKLEDQKINLIESNDHNHNADFCFRFF